MEEFGDHGGPDGGLGDSGHGLGGLEAGLLCAGWTFWCCWEVMGEGLR